ncbi:MAG: 6-pyruvoyl tetrahydropterin synthase family protein [Lacipirellulaceae bacterium]
MNESYRVKIEKERLVFSAAHFITYNGDVCEPLHGHNYHVRAEVAGPLDENHYVIDFIALRDSLQKIVDGLDHRMILPTEHQTISVKSENNEIIVRHGERRWVFPEQDCVLLPVANTTAELLARWIGGQLLSAFEEKSLPRPEVLVIEVDECDGQWAVWQISDA